MAHYLEKAEKKGYDIVQIVGLLISLKIDEEKNRYGIMMIRCQHGFVFWSKKGMVRLGPNPDETGVALALLTLGCKADTAENRGVHGFSPDKFKCFS